MDKGVLDMKQAISGTGTKVIVTKEGMLKIISVSEKAELKEGERLLDCVRYLNIDVAPDEVITANISCFIAPTVIPAVPPIIEFIAPDPGDLFQKKVVQKIIYDDGSEWEAT